MHIFEIEVTGTNSMEDASDLQIWLKREKCLSIEALDQKPQQSRPGEMGSELIPILTLILASPMITELIRSLFSWLEAKRKTHPITVSIGDKKVTFKSSDIENVKEIIRTLENRNEQKT